MKLSKYLAKTSGREQVMFGALVLVGFLIWGSVLLRQWDRLAAKHKQIRGELTKQAIWLADADRFEAELQRSLSVLDADMTMDAEALVTLVDEIARDGGLAHDLGTPVTDNRSAFIKHSLKVGVKNASLNKLIDFERALREHYPYAALHDFTISANKADPRLLNVRLTLVSYQYATLAESP